MSYSLKQTQKNSEHYLFFIYSMMYVSKNVVYGTTALEQVGAIHPVACIQSHAQRIIVFEKSRAYK